MNLEFGSEFVTTVTSDIDVAFNVFVNFGETPTVQGKLKRFSNI